MAVTIKDVAERAGVSIASVSRALHGTGVVTEKTRHLVQRAAKELRYTPHETARSLITRRTNTVGVLLPDIYGEYFSELIQSIDRAARQRGLHLLVSGSHGDAAETARVLRSMNGRVDGVLVMSPYADAALVSDSLPDALPAVLLNTPSDTDTRSAIQIDNYGGAMAMVQHLRELGHRHITHITGPVDNFESAERLRGFQAAMNQVEGGRAEVIVGDFTEDFGFRAGAKLAAASVRPDAIFAANDMMAIGCLFAFRQAGLSVPRDIALAGFDDIPVARYVSPPLTTVRTQAKEIGKQALDKLAHAIDNPDAVRGDRIILKTELVIRSSCGAQALTS